MWYLRDNLTELSTLNANDLECTPQEKCYRNWTAEKVLLHVCWNWRGGEPEWFEVEKIEIGTLMELCLPAIFLKMELESDLFPTSSFRCAREVRSGLQYILDIFKHFPTENGLLETPLLIFQSKLYSELDLPDYDECLVNFEPDLWDPVIRVIFIRYPDNHVWWKRNAEE